MQNKSIPILCLAWLLNINAYAKVPEIENNDNAGSANPVPAIDEVVGQMNSPTDEDWYSVSITNPNQTVTPVYFGCNYKLGDIHTEGVTEDDKSNWRVTYYNSAGHMQGNYIVDPTNCKQGSAETKGPLRFEMNTQAPGTYYISVTGRHIGIRAIKKLVPDSNGKYESQDWPVDVYIANTGDYKIRVYTGRVEGQIEPNDGMSDAYPVPTGKEVRSQSSSQYDQDWFYFDYNAAVSSAAASNFYFKCADAPTGAAYMLSVYDAQGVMQNAYEVSQPQCSITAGYKMIVNTPASGRYYVLVSPPTYTNTAEFTQADYIVSTSAITSTVDNSGTNNGGTSNNGGTNNGGTTTDPNAMSGILKTANIVDQPTAAKDTFSATVNQCGNTKGVVKLTGSNLNLSGLTADTQVKVAVGGWSCTSDTKTTTTATTAKGKKTYVYPKPVVITPTPTIKPGYSGITSSAP